MRKLNALAWVSTRTYVADFTHEITSTIALILITACLPLLDLVAQDSVTLNGKTLNGSSIRSGYWLFQDQQDTIIALTMTEFSKIDAELSGNTIAVAWKDSIIAAQERELEAYRNYESNADQLVITQDQMIIKADSLYTGYKQLYKDLKKLTVQKTFSLVAGSGFYRIDQNDPSYIFNLGLEYRRLQVSYDFGGNGYKGFSMQYRVPVF